MAAFAGTGPCGGTSGVAGLAPGRAGAGAAAGRRTVAEGASGQPDAHRGLSAMALDLMGRLVIVLAGGRLLMSRVRLLARKISEWPGRLNRERAMRVSRDLAGAGGNDLWAACRQPHQSGDACRGERGRGSAFLLCHVASPWTLRVLFRPHRADTPLSFFVASPRGHADEALLVSLSFATPVLGSRLSDSAGKSDRFGQHSTGILT